MTTATNQRRRSNQIEDVVTTEPGKEGEEGAPPSYAEAMAGAGDVIVSQP